MMCMDWYWILVAVDWLADLIAFGHEICFIDIRYYAHVVGSDSNTTTEATTIATEGATGTLYFISYRQDGSK